MNEDLQYLIEQNQKLFDLLKKSHNILSDRIKTLEDIIDELTNQPSHLEYKSNTISQ